MVDAIQAKSSIPLPGFQSEEAYKNTPPIGSPKDIEQVETTSADARAAAAASKFEDYLNQSSITTLDKTESNTAFDPAAAITSGSVYSQPGGSGAI